MSKKLGSGLVAIVLDASDLAFIASQLGIISNWHTGQAESASSDGRPASAIRHRSDSLRAHTLGQAIAKTGNFNYLISEEK